MSGEREGEWGRGGGGRKRGVRNRGERREGREKGKRVGDGKIKRAKGGREG